MNIDSPLSIDPYFFIPSFLIIVFSLPYFLCHDGKNYFMSLFSVIVFLVVALPNYSARLYRYNYYESLPINELEKIYATDAPYKLRRLLDRYYAMDLHNFQDRKSIAEFSKKIECRYKCTRKNLLIEAVSYISLFSEKFIINSFEKSDESPDCKLNRNDKIKAFYNIGIFISHEDYAERLRFVLYENSKNEYEICDVALDNFTDFIGLEHIWWKPYRKYWI